MGTPVSLGPRFAGASLVFSLVPPASAPAAASQRLPSPFPLSSHPAAPAPPSRRQLSARSRLTRPAGLASPDDPVLEDRTVQVKLMLAEGSGKLDLSECGLATLPLALFDLTDLQELSLAGNQLQELPEAVGRLTALKRLQLAGNSLQNLPNSLGNLTSLEGIWLHGNRLTSLPPTITALGQLSQLSLAGNCLEILPEGLGALSALRELSVAGNCLQELPPSLGALSALSKLSAHGNMLSTLPAEVDGLQALEELWLQGNSPLSSLPPQLGQLAALKHLSAADCSLGSVPGELGNLPRLQSLSLYGNRLQEVPPEVLQAPELRYVWLEANPLTPPAVTSLLEAAAAPPAAAGGGAAAEEAGGGGHPPTSLRSLGLDSSQVEGIPEGILESCGEVLRPCSIQGSGPGYFKLETAEQHAVAAGDVSSSPRSSSTSASGAVEGAEQRLGRVLVVSFGSAPGTPNWGGVLSRVRAAAGTPPEADFDVLYVVDPSRAWYGGGDQERYQQYEDRLRGVTSRYQHVVLIGDSMGATAALLFAHLATAVHAFCPQVDLTSSSIRPGESPSWFAALRERVMRSVDASSADVRVHVGNWSHDLDQARMLPPAHVRTHIYSVDSHRLALVMDRQGKLEGVIRGAILQELGLPSGNVRLANLV